jgi:hypothetical protein
MPNVKKLQAIIIVSKPTLLHTTMLGSQEAIVKSPAWIRQVVNVHRARRPSPEVWLH